jgi:hypothetical protein
MFITYYCEGIVHVFQKYELLQIQLPPLMRETKSHTRTKQQQNHEAPHLSSPVSRTIFEADTSRMSGALLPEPVCYIKYKI